MRDQKAIFKQRMEDYRYHLATVARLSFDPEHQKMLRKLFTASHECVWEINGKDGPIVQVELLEGRVACINPIQVVPQWIYETCSTGREFIHVLEAIKAHGQPITIVARD